MVGRARENLEQIVAFACGRVALDHGGVREDRGFELDMRVEADLDLDETLHRKADRDRVEARGITIDHAALFQIFHARPAGRFGERSEEHTSELQSLMRISYAVFCLKKKKHTQVSHSAYNTLDNTTADIRLQET